ncbi:MAG: DUF1593 domain-containing protein [Bacteroidales bacterium]|nr:DUF1593 domain-containing protein [Bacteroidales bacterium]MBN2818781.1 DUF1593 domain-containing protein [Bacteroidales bacterium]
MSLLKFKPIQLVFSLAILTCLVQYNIHAAPLKPRIIVLTDISTWETDDHESLTRLLVHADLYEIEGIVFTTGYSWSDISSTTAGLDLINGVIDAYELDLPNLMLRSNQNGFNQDTGRQEIGYWPSADYLRDRVMKGSPRRGMQYIGEGNNSDGSNLIIEQADEDDERSLWISIWGGGNTLAQAVWQVQQTRSEEAFKTFLHRIPSYSITDQDRHYDGSEGYEISCHQWLRREFADDLLFIWDERAWTYQNGTGKSNWSEYETHIQGHGNLGNQYPKYKYGVEGDTPAFLHILPNGLNDPDDPTQAGWGGYSAWGIGPDNKTFAYNNHTGTANAVCLSYVSKFYPATFNNFAARMDWASNGTGNRNPVVEVNGDEGINILSLTPKPDSTVVLDASTTYDPDGDSLTFRWWIQIEAGTYKKNISIKNSDSSVAKISIPSDAEGKTFHVICEVTDNGTHNLSAYKRIIFKPSVAGIEIESNQLPVAFAGPDQTIIDSDDNGVEIVELYGTGSNDFDGSITSYAWSESGNEIGIGAIISHEFSVGEHNIELLVTDDEGASDSDIIIVKIKEQATNSSVLLPVNSGIILYPNPITNELSISSEKSPFYIAIYNILGMIMYSSVSTEELFNIDTGNFPEGVYNVLITDKEENTYGYKLLKL